MALTTTTTMKAIVRQRYGAPDVLSIQPLERPVPNQDEVLVRVRACSVNPVDWYEVTGTPWIARPMTGLRRPKSIAVGHDFSGTVDAVGKAVTELQPGDDVFGSAGGAFAEFVCVEKGVGRKPSNLTFEEAAAVPIAGLTALQALRVHGRLEPGQHVLVNGASGGVGTFAVQIAKAMGAEVTAVCSTGNVEQARSLGADRVIDYVREDFTQADERYDVILDVSGTKGWSRYRRVMGPESILVMIGSPKGHPFLGPLGHIARLKLASWRGTQQAVFFMANVNRPDLDFLREMLETDKVRPVVERRYQFGDVTDALRHLGGGHAQGKIVLTVDPRQ